MKKHVLQWHITHKCNLRCSHCYQEEYECDLGRGSLENIFYQYIEFLNHHNYRGHINFTGGEPFVSKDIFYLLDLCEKNKISFGILTNGTLLDTELVKKLSTYEKLSFVQISIDGIKEVHDKIRGNGNFEKAFETFRLLRKNHIQTISTQETVSQNY